MSARIYKNGTWTDIIEPKIYSGGGGWKSPETIKRYAGGAWVTVWEKENYAGEFTHKWHNFPGSFGSNFRSGGNDAIGNFYITGSSASVILVCNSFYMSRGDVISLDYSIDGEPYNNTSSPFYVTNLLHIRYGSYYYGENYKTGELQFVPGLTNKLPHADGTVSMRASENATKFELRIETDVTSSSSNYYGCKVTFQLGHFRVGDKKYRFADINI